MAKKEKVANRLYIDAKGGSLGQDPTDAVGVRYESLDGNKKVIRTTEVADLAKINPRGVHLLALFGLKTWVGNLYNQHDEDTDAIDAKLASVTVDGVWPERIVNIGPRYDHDALVMAIATVKGTQDLEPIAKRVKDEKGYAGNAMSLPAVLAEYNKLTNKAAFVL